MCSEAARKEMNGRVATQEEKNSHIKKVDVKERKMEGVEFIRDIK